MTVREAVIKNILKHYPIVPTHAIHNAHSVHPYSGGQRLRELRDNGIVFEHKYFIKRKGKMRQFQHYDFSATKKRDINALLA